MDWTYPSEHVDDPNAAMRVIAERLSDYVGIDADTDVDGGGGPLQASRLLYDATEMLDATRQIEAAAGPQTRLLTGFQRSAKYSVEAARYRDIVNRGVMVTAFGTGTPERHVDNVRWVQLDDSRWRLENQWFLLTTGPEPLVFVGYEISPDPLFGEGGISDPDKQFVGFVSDDPRIVAAIDTYLESVASSKGAAA